MRQRSALGAAASVALILATVTVTYGQRTSPQFSFPPPSANQFGDLFGNNANQDLNNLAGQPLQSTNSAGPQGSTFVQFGPSGSSQSSSSSPSSSPAQQSFTSSLQNQFSSKPQQLISQSLPQQQQQQQQFQPFIAASPPQPLLPPQLPPQMPPAAPSQPAQQQQQQRSQQQEQQSQPSSVQLTRPSLSLTSLSPNSQQQQQQQQHPSSQTRQAAAAAAAANQQQQQSLQSTSSSSSSSSSSNNQVALAAAAAAAAAALPQPAAPVAAPSTPSTPLSATLSSARHRQPQTSSSSHHRSVASAASTTTSNQQSSSGSGSSSNLSSSSSPAALRHQSQQNHQRQSAAAHTHNQLPLAGNQPSQQSQQAAIDSARRIEATQASLAAGSSGHSYQCPDSFGYFRHHKSCDKYWACDNGTATLKLCGNGLMFDDSDPKRENCAYPFSVDCGSDRTDLEPPISTPNCPRLYGLFSDNANCRIFYSCWNGESSKYECPPGLAYDSEQRVCVWADLVDRCDQSEVSDGFVCPDPTEVDQPGHYTRHAHPTDCRKFYVCIDGVARPYGCSFGTVFNVDSLQCDEPESVSGCEKYYGDLDPKTAKKLARENSSGQSNNRQSASASN